MTTKYKQAISELPLNPFEIKSSRQTIQRKMNKTRFNTMQGDWQLEIGLYIHGNLI